MDRDHLFDMTPVYPAVDVVQQLIDEENRRKELEEKRKLSDNKSINSRILNSQSHSKQQQQNLNSMSSKIALPASRPSTSESSITKSSTRSIEKSSSGTSLASVSSSSGVLLTNTSTLGETNDNLSRVVKNKNLSHAKNQLRSRLSTIDSIESPPNKNNDPTCSKTDTSDSIHLQKSNDRQHEKNLKLKSQPIPASNNRISYSHTNQLRDSEEEIDEEESYEKVLWSYSTMTSAIKLSSTPEIDSTMERLASATRRGQSDNNYTFSKNPDDLDKNSDHDVKIIANPNSAANSMSSRHDQITKILGEISSRSNHNNQTDATQTQSSISQNQHLLTNQNHFHQFQGYTKWKNSRDCEKDGHFEIVPKSAILDVYSSDPEVEKFLYQLPRICIEFGYNQQDYKCYSCRRPIGMIYGPSRVCNYDGHLYCVECHINEQSVIPARILCNWDFEKLPVSKRNQNFLCLISTEPLFDLKLLSPLLYSVYPEVRKILDLRQQAFFLRSYCFTCTQDTISFELTKLVWPREHLIEHIHLYSLEDLEQIKSGSMALLLKKVIAFARKHVLSCLLCSQKGFICELCKSSQILYPFDTDSIYRCDKCQSVFHLHCFSSLPTPDDCPRCSRLRNRRTPKSNLTGVHSITSQRFIDSTNSSVSNQDSSVMVTASSSQNQDRNQLQNKNVCVNGDSWASAT